VPGHAASGPSKYKLAVALGTYPFHNHKSAVGARLEVAHDRRVKVIQNVA
jgi:hypothetical protein